jgi:hypothetical protein
MITQTPEFLLNLARISSIRVDGSIWFHWMVKHGVVVCDNISEPTCESLWTGEDMGWKLVDYSVVCK